jgi:hypothetical protein
MTSRHLSSIARRTLQGLGFVGSAWVAQAQCPLAIERTALLAPDAAAGRNFGESIALEATTLLVGAPGGSASAAYVFARAGGAWSLQQELHPSASIDSFGVDVDLSGSTAVVGSPNDAPLGAVYVFARSGATWSLESKIPAPISTFAAGSFGRAVAIDGDQLVVGSPNGGPCCNFPGEVHVYARAGTTWSLQTTLSSPQGFDFGAEVDLEGTHLLVSNPDPFPFDLPGFVHPYEGGGATWTPEPAIQSGWNFSDSFGRSLEIEGTQLAIGSQGSSDVPEKVYLYDWTGTGWQFVSALSPVSGSQMEFGVSVALAGPWLAVGALYDDESGLAAGSLHLYERPGPFWQAAGEVFQSTPEEFSTFGWAAAFDGNTFVAAAPASDVPALDCGKVPVFTLVLGPTTYCSSQPNSLGCLPKAEFSGTPSLSSPIPFVLTARLLLNQKPGILFYGVDGPLAAPFNGGTLCVRPPIVRTPVQSTNGSGGMDCSGTLSFDFTAHANSGADPRLDAGITVHSQFWSRDPQSAFTTNLTDAIEFVLCP